MSGWAEGPVAGDDGGQQGAQLGDPHPPQERRADDQDRGLGHPAPVGPSPAAAGRAVGAVRTVLQPAVAVRGERYGGGRGDLQPVGEVAHQAVEVGGRLLGDRDGRAEGGSGARDDHGDQRGQRQAEHREAAGDPAGEVPARAEMAGHPAREQHHGHRRGQQRHGQRGAADPQHGEGAGTRRQDACFRTCHEPVHPLLSCWSRTERTRDGRTRIARCAERAHSPPTVAPATDIAMPVSHLPDAAVITVPESGTATAGRLRGTLVGGFGPVSRLLGAVTRWNGFGQSREPVSEGHRSRAIRPGLHQ